MRPFLFTFLLLLATPVFAAPAATAPLSHALTLFGDPKYPADFKQFDYVNPQAPKGGRLRQAALSTFDSTNPFILKGIAAPGISMLFESLMTASLDEPQSLYPLLATGYRLAPDHASIEFTLNEKARWHDGSPITPEDIVFSLDTLKKEGDPVYKITYEPIPKAEVTGQHTVRFTLADPKNRELPLLAASMPILSKAYYTAHDFTKTTLEPPLGSGPYRVKSLDQGRSITYERVPDYWGRDLPVNIGQHNFDELRYDVYLDETVALEALKGGQYDLRQEYIARNWATAYDTPAVTEGRLIKREIPSAIPQGMQAFAFNTRKPYLADPRVREAISAALDFEWINRTLFYSAYTRNTSYFQNTEFAATGTPEGTELALLEPFRTTHPSGLYTQPFALPVTDGTGNDRAPLLRAQKLLDDAGWIVEGGYRVSAATGEPLEVEFLMNQPTMQRVIQPMLKALRRLGIVGRMRMVDDAQYQSRVQKFDFDVISIWINRGVFFPGTEQTNYWHSSQADIPGSNNVTGLKDPAIDALLTRLMAAETLEDLRPAARALDRVLLWNHLVIPNWHSGVFRVAYWNKFGLPQTMPKYGLGLDAWWFIAPKPESEGGSKENTSPGAAE